MKILIVVRKGYGIHILRMVNSFAEFYWIMYRLSMAKYYLECSFFKILMMVNDTSPKSIPTYMVSF